MSMYGNMSRYNIGNVWRIWRHLKIHLLFPMGILGTYYSNVWSTVKARLLQDSSIASPERSPISHLSRIWNTVFGATTNPMLALKTNLTNSCGGGSPSRLAINESRSFPSLNCIWLQSIQVFFSSLFITIKNGNFSKLFCNLHYSKDQFSHW